MSQNAERISWPREEVDGRLLQIMQGIHAACLKYGARPDGSVSYVDVCPTNTTRAPAKTDLQLIPKPSGTLPRSLWITSARRRGFG